MTCWFAHCIICNGQCQCQLRSAINLPLLDMASQINATQVYEQPRVDLFDSIENQRKNGHLTNCRYMLNLDAFSCYNNFSANETNQKKNGIQFVFSVIACDGQTRDPFISAISVQGENRCKWDTEFRKLKQHSSFNEQSLTIKIIINLEQMDGIHLSIDCVHRMDSTISTDASYTLILWIFMHSILTKITSS